MSFYSPLRYPGGKGKLYKQTLEIIKSNNLLGCTYIEPFAGGANLALNLLFKENVNKISLNDADPAIYALWYSILNKSDDFINFIQTVPLTINEYKKQKNIYINEKEDLFLLGTATFYLNRTNRSGIIKGGPIGGYEQTGNYLMDCRFNRENLSARVKKIYDNKESIQLSCMDARDFLKQDFAKHSFIFIDPPYYNKGSTLYENYLNHNDHEEISNIVKKLKVPWVVTYDDTPEIIKMYSFSNSYNYHLSYTVERKRIGNEVMFHHKTINI